MKEGPAYTEFHPRWYRAQLSTYWWLGRWPYFRFILRELSSVFVAVWAVITLLLVNSLIHGPEAYAKFQAWLATPFVIAASAVGLLFLLFHTITWFKAAPQAMVVRIRGQRVPAILIVAANYVAWLVVSGGIAWLLLGE